MKNNFFIIAVVIKSVSTLIITYFVILIYSLAWWNDYMYYNVYNCIVYIDYCAVSPIILFINAKLICDSIFHNIRGVLDLLKHICYNSIQYNTSIYVWNGSTI